jgi:hypothetical protein
MVGGSHPALLGPRSAQFFTLNAAEGMEPGNSMMRRRFPMPARRVKSPFLDHAATRSSLVSSPQAG